MKIPTDTPTYHFYNANPKCKLTSDCSIRAIALATGKEWDIVFDELCDMARKYKQMPNDKKLLNRYLKSKGWIKQPQPKREDGTKYTGEEWCRKLTEERCAYSSVIANIGGHHMICITQYNEAYTIHDTWDCSEYCIGNYWIKA